MTTTTDRLASYARAILTHARNGDALTTACVALAALAHADTMRHEFEHGEPTPLAEAMRDLCADMADEFGAVHHAAAVAEPDMHAATYHALRACARMW